VRVGIIASNRYPQFGNRKFGNRRFVMKALALLALKRKRNPI
jgi:hypothetical protein